MRSLIDMAADRGAFIDQSQSLNLFMESPNIGKLSSMYMLRLEEGPEDDVLPALAPGDAHQPDHDGRHHGRDRPPTAPDEAVLQRRPRPWPARSRTPSRAKPATEQPLACSLENPDLREPATAWPDRRHDAAHRTVRCTSRVDHSPITGTRRRPTVAIPSRGAGMLLDPGFNLTLRPMRYPDFYEMYRNAIKNTWTVEEVDFSDDVVDLHRKMMPAERHLINRLVAFFATGDSIVVEQPGAQPLQAHQRARGAACTCRASSSKRRCTSSST